MTESVWMFLFFSQGILLMFTKEPKIKEFKNDYAYPFDVNLICKQGLLFKNLCRIIKDNDTFLEELAKTLLC